MWSKKTIVFTLIRYSSEFRNAYSLGIPLNIYRPTHEAVKDFSRAGNLLKKMSERKIRGLEREFVENLPAR